MEGGSEEFEGGSEYSDVQSIKCQEIHEKLDLTTFKDPYSEKSKNTIRLFFKKAFDFKLKKNEMPLDLRKIEYVYVDVQLNFEKVEGVMDQALDEVYSRAA